METQTLTPILDPPQTPVAFRGRKKPRPGKPSKDDLSIRYSLVRSNPCPLTKSTHLVETFLVLSGGIAALGLVGWLLGTGIGLLAATT